MTEKLLLTQVLPAVIPLQSYKNYQLYPGPKLRQKVLFLILYTQI